MSYYSLSKEERIKFNDKIYREIYADIEQNTSKYIQRYFSDIDTYTRKQAYLAIGKIFKNEISLQEKIINQMEELIHFFDEKIRQTVVYAAGEIMIYDAEKAKHIIELGLKDTHHSVRNAVIGSLKKAGEKNPAPIIEFCNKYINHHDKEIRRQVCHGLELRGRTHPEEVLPILQKLEFETEKRVAEMLIHVVGQISYKKNCLEKVLHHLKTWKNKALVKQILREIILVHESYEKFSAKNVDEVKKIIDQYDKNLI
ncbi:MAG TPA: hypothetical protein DDX39_10270 [Bacteroidales bacterium]|nr:hypothetical protein [Bacteroidales bacterium]